MESFLVAPGIGLGSFVNLGNEADLVAGTCPGSRLVAQVGLGGWRGCLGGLLFLGVLGTPSAGWHCR